MDSTLKRILLVGHDNRLYHDVLKEAVEIAINDGAVTKQEACEILDDFSTFEATEAKAIGDKYMIGKVCRHDIDVGLRWYYIAAQKGNSIAAGYLAGILGAEAVSEINDAGHPNVAMELLCAAAWWGNLAFGCQPFTRSEDALGANVLGEKWSPRDLSASQTRRLVAEFIEEKRRQYSAKGREERIKAARDAAIADAEAARAEASKAEAVKEAKATGKKVDKAESEQDAKITRAVAEFHREIEEAGDDGDDVLDVSVSIRDIPGHIVAVDGVETNGTRVGESAILKNFAHLSTPLPVPVMPTDLAAMETALVAEFPYASRVIGEMVKDLRLRQSFGSEVFVIKPTLMLGPPGVGKTRLAKHFGAISECAVEVISVGGMSDNRDFDGTSRGWGNGMPSLPARVLARQCVGGAMFVVDEIDKTGTGRHNGNMFDSLVNVLEGQNVFRDSFLGTRLDLSACSWILTANDISQVPLPLLNRCRILEVDKPKAEHVPAIVKGIIVDIAVELGVHPMMIDPISGHEMDALIKLYHDSVSIRSLRRGVERVLEIRERSKITH